jgi:hypothetical protein
VADNSKSFPGRTREERVLAKLTAARLEGDDQTRRQWLREVFVEPSEDEPGVTDAEIDALSSEIAKQLEDPTWFLSTNAKPRHLGGRWIFCWRSRGSDNVSWEHEAEAEFSDGRIRRLRPVRSAEVEGSNWRPVARWIIRNPLPALALAGAVATLLVHVYLDLFYGPLGVTPEQAGFGADQLIRQSVLLLLLVLGVSIAVGMSLVAFGFPLVGVFRALERLEQLGEGRKALLLLAPCVVPGIVVLALFATTLVTGRPVYFLIAVALALLFGLVFPQVFNRVPLARRAVDAVRDKDRREGLNDPLVGVLVMCMALVTVAVVVGLPIAAVSTSASVKRGGEVSTGLVPWKARPAYLRWGSGKRPFGLRGLHNTCRDLRYLGTADNRLLVYDTNNNQAFSVPQADASLALVPDCKTTQVAG